MIYAALLRGINVGGNSRIEMPRLKKIFESVGCANVVTYINSGNVVFQDDRPKTELGPLIEEGIRQEFGLDVPVLLRDQASVNKLCQEIPEDWTNDSQMRTDVLFLWDKYDAPEVLDKIIYKPEIERVRYMTGAVVWNVDRENVTRGSMVKLVGSDLYKHMTIRNINTVRKLNDLMQNIKTR